MHPIPKLGSSDIINCFSILQACFAKQDRKKNERKKEGKEKKSCLKQVHKTNLICFVMMIDLIHHTHIYRLKQQRRKMNGFKLCGTF